MKRCLVGKGGLVLMIVLGFSGGLLRASEKSYDLTVHAGSYDRSNTPVCVVLKEASQQANLDPVLLEKARSVLLTDEKGNCLPAQLTRPGLLNQADPAEGAVVRELHFILPELKRGRSLRLRAVLSEQAPAASGFAWEKQPGKVELRFNKRPVLCYVCPAYDRTNLETRRATFRKFHHVYSPDGSMLVSKGPGGLHQHHRGLFFSYNHITYGDGKRANPWAGPGYDESYEADAGILSEEAGPVLGRHCVAIDWHADKETVFAKEKRELAAYAVPGGILIEFATRLATTSGKVRLDGNAQHAGFQFRASNEVAEKTAKKTYYLRPGGKGAPGETRNPDNAEKTDRCKNLPWKGMSFVVGGKRLTALYLDNPANPKPCRYGERDYGRFGSYFKYELDDGKDLVARYRFWLQFGEMDVPQAEAMRKDFVEPVEVVVGG